MKVDSAIILAAGCATRLVPISYEIPKALLVVKGQTLIERQICQLKEAGISTIVVVVGYMKEKLYFLREKYGVILVENNEYACKNNISSIFAAKDYICNSYICSADNYYEENPFFSDENESFYTALYSKEYTKEWCLEIDKEETILNVNIGGENAWYMLGHAFWTKAFRDTFFSFLDEEYCRHEIYTMLWESFYLLHISDLKMKAKKYNEKMIYEFDTLEELREYDPEYMSNTNSLILMEIAQELDCSKSDIKNIRLVEENVRSFTFEVFDKKYKYILGEGMVELNDENLR